jgi:hypothetical protein
MMYIFHPSLLKLKEDLAAFYTQTLSIQEQQEAKTLKRP